MNALVAYFSATGTTAKAAKTLANAVGGELYEIKPAVPYTSADLNWRDQNSRSSVEMKDPSSRPAISGQVDNMADYDVIFVGSPCWWATIAPPIATFLSSYNLSGKTVIPFMTHEGSRMGHSEKEIRELCPESVLLQGLPIRGSKARQAAPEIKKWLQEIGVTQH